MVGSILTGVVGTTTYLTNFDWGESVTCKCFQWGSVAECYIHVRKKLAHCSLTPLFALSLFTWIPLLSHSLVSIDNNVDFGSSSIQYGQATAIRFRYSCNQVHVGEESRYGPILESPTNRGLLGSGQRILDRGTISWLNQLILTSCSKAIIL